MSEVIEARGHPGRKSHESRASGREQCRETRLRLLLLSFFVRFPLLPSFRSISFLPLLLRLLRHLLLLLFFLFLFILFIFHLFVMSIRVFSLADLRFDSLSSIRFHLPKVEQTTRRLRAY